ncbi:MAG TPA: hypothetical protein EYN43_06420 [Gammaproteobacteria bacterium]|nr:MAG: hypothetical protein DSZ34_01200 [Gammaproteobacteria bacterium]HAD36188.1 hypothetical protein [Gammaproteobacteria bacterium]HIA42082.1 hypothetical protein [Gammaproteobacteria bacterium]HIP04665.1 hypothetical protein [Gammaproteobacteria bacterium]
MINNPSRSYCDGKLTSVDLFEGSLINANLTGINLTRADLLKTFLNGAKLENVIFCMTRMPNGTEDNSGC